MLLPTCTTHECPYPVAHLYTHTFGEGLRCRCLLAGGAWCGKGHQPHPPSACRGVACTVPAILRAGPHNIPPYGRHRACRRAIAYCTEVRSTWCGGSRFLLQLDRQAQQVDPRSAERRRHKLPTPHQALWPTEVHVVVREKVFGKGCYFLGIHTPLVATCKNKVCISNICHYLHFWQHTNFQNKDIQSPKCSVVLHLDHCNSSAGWGGLPILSLPFVPR